MVVQWEACAAPEDGAGGIVGGGGGGAAMHPQMRCGAEGPLPTAVDDHQNPRHPHATPPVGPKEHGPAIVLPHGIRRSHCPRADRRQT